MARISKIDMCLICGDTPCSCKGKKSPRVLAVPVVEPSPPKPPVVLEIPALRPRYQPQPRHRSEHSVQLDENELVLIAALRSLQPILHPETLEQYKSAFLTPPSLDERVAFWKAQHDDSKNTDP